LPPRIASGPRARRPAARIHGHRPPPHARIVISVDLSDESAFAVKWAVQNYLRTGDAVVLLHVRPTAVLYGADWDSIPVSDDDDALPAAPSDEPDEARKKRAEDFDAFTSIKV
jgi:nucleotide-binding universal stress UspA family protein